MVIFLSTGMLEELSRRLIEGGYEAETPAAIVYKATWPDEKKFICTVGTLAQTATENNITKDSLDDHRRCSEGVQSMTVPSCMIRDLQQNSVKQQE